MCGGSLELCHHFRSLWFVTLCQPPPQVRAPPYLNTYTMRRKCCKIWLLKRSTMALFFKPPPSPPAPIPSHHISIAEDEKFALHVAKHFRLALENLAHLMKEASGEREPSLSHHYISGTLSIFNDPKYEPLWPIFYPTTHFETNLLRQIHAIRTDLKEINATTTPPAPPPPNRPPSMLPHL